MPLTFKLPNLDGLDAAISALYKKDGDAFVLDVTGAPTGDEAAHAEIVKFKAKALEAQNEAIDRRKDLDEWKKIADTPAAARQKITDAGKDNKGAAEHEAIVAELKAGHATELTGRDETITDLRRGNTGSELKAELAKAGVKPDYVDMLAGFAKGRIKYHDDGSVKILADDMTKRMVGLAPDGGATIADLAESLAKGVPDLVSANRRSGSGKPPLDGGGKPDPKKTATRAEFDEMSHSDRSTFANEGGKVVA